MDGAGSRERKGFQMPQETVETLQARIDQLEQKVNQLEKEIEQLTTPQLTREASHETR